MIKISIDGVPIETLFKETNIEIDNLLDHIKILKDHTKTLEDNKTQLFQKVDLLEQEIINLQNQIIDMQNEGAKERNSFWDFLKSNKNPKKTSRIKETTVQLDK